MTDFYRWQHLLEQSISVFKLIWAFWMLSVAGKIIAVAGCEIFWQQPSMSFYQQE